MTRLIENLKFQPQYIGKPKSEKARLIEPSKNSTAILIPKGFVHGLLALEKETIVVNFCSKPYNPKKEFGINFKSLKIKLPRIKLLISRKDKNLPDLHLVKKK